MHLEKTQIINKKYAENWDKIFGPKEPINLFYCSKCSKAHSSNSFMDWAPNFSKLPRVPASLATIKRGFSYFLVCANNCQKEEEAIESKQEAYDQNYVAKADKKDNKINEKEKQSSFASLSERAKEIPVINSSSSLLPSIIQTDEELIQKDAYQCAKCYTEISRKMIFGFNTLVEYPRDKVIVLCKECVLKHQDEKHLIKDVRCHSQATYDCIPYYGEYFSFADDVTKLHAWLNKDKN